MHVIALAQQKGGVMKSTLTINIAAEALRKGRRAVILELDKQGTVSIWGANRRAIAEAHDLIKGAAKLTPEVMQIDAARLTQILTVLSNHGVSLAVLDLPRSHNTAVNQAIKAADLVLLPTRPQETHILASAEPLAVVQRLRKPYAYVMTFVEDQGQRSDEVQAALEEEGHRVCPQFIWRRQVYADAVSEGLKEQKEKAADEIKKLWQWLHSQLGTKANGTVEGHDQQASEAHC